MSDFDAVLERLLNEPSFAVDLAADPDAALSRYQLDAGETELLRSQVSGDTGGALAAVENRTNKSSTFGMFSTLSDLGGPVPAGPPAAPLGPWSEFGTAAGIAAQHAGETAGSHAGFGSAPDAWGGAGGEATENWEPPAVTGFGSAQESGTDLDGLGDAPRTGLGAPGHSTAEPEHLAPPKGYHPRIDADGDGHWDKATYYGTKDGGAEIRIDLNGDGQADFVGHDAAADGRVDYADYDKNHDGVYEKRMYDDNGDGWLDRTVWPEH